MEAEVGLIGKHTVCNFSCKYLWRMAVTHYREPKGGNCGRARLGAMGCKRKLQSQCCIAVKQERWRDSKKEVCVSQMERTIKRLVDEEGRESRSGDKRVTRVWP